MAFRRHLATGIRRSSGAVWPIKPDTKQTPVDWQGWPGGKKFALVLTHDVEGPPGITGCSELIALEQELGLRSSFNFIPEGSYDTPAELRDQLTGKGFEVGVHDLHHNGKLYRSETDFAAAAAKINRYLKEWGAVGFRSGFMHHNLQWIHALEIQYDLSTFDTDPFEPQPDGVDTIFPFWVQHPLIERAGYVEIPYTLPQDSTLFLVLREKSISVWKRKLDWIAEQGGMALLNVHPDYMSFRNGTSTGAQYPSRFYREFLEYVLAKYGTSCWFALPRDVAAFLRKSLPIAAANNGHAASSNLS